MQDYLVLDLKRALSTERFSEYASTAANDREAIGRYLWNTRLSEALYPSLENLEIAFRNRIHAAISALYPDGPFNDVQCWLDRRVPILDDTDVRAVRHAKERLASNFKPLEPGGLIAELNLGFWTSLLDVRYERNSVFWPKLLKPVFAAMPRHDRKRKVISSRFNRIRLLRNRVFHVEPIWHWRDLRQQHSQILECISWLSPALLDITRRIDRFDDVYFETWNKYTDGDDAPAKVPPG